MKCVITADASGKTLQELSKLVGERVKGMKESARYSVGAVAINVLKSVRAATRKRRMGGKVKIK